MAASTMVILKIHALLKSDFREPFLFPPSFEFRLLRECKRLAVCKFHIDTKCIP